MREMKFILNGKRPEACSNTLRWGRWMEAADRQVALTKIGECVVSTVFLGLDHGFHDNGPPILFETMAFGPQYETTMFGRTRTTRDDMSMDRYATWEEAEVGHQRVVAEMQAMQQQIERDAKAALRRIGENVRESK